MVEGKGSSLQETLRLYAEHPVIQVLRARRAAGSRPGQRGDDHKVGLAVQGGGMRGVVSAAMLAAIEDLGYTGVFDAVYGCSAGSINAAYFLAGQCWYGLTIYFDELTTRSFVDFRRALVGRSILDIHYAFDHVIDRVKPLRYDRVLESPIPLSVSVTSVDDRAALSPTEFSSRDDLKAALRAGAWIPVGVSGTAVFRGGRALDGGLLQPHPFRVALDDGCTHVLSLSTKPPPPAARSPARVSILERLTRTYLDRQRSGLGDAYIDALRRYRARRPELDRSLLSPGDGPYLLDLSPSPAEHEIARHEIRLPPLLRGARDAYQRVVLALEQERQTVVLRLSLPPAVQE